MTKLILGPMIGGLNDTQAYIWGRADGPGILHAWVGRNPDLSDLSQPTAESLREAQLFIKKKYKHPAYWASFVLTGDYR